MSSIFGGWRLNQKPFCPDSIEKVVHATSWWNPDKQGVYHQHEIFLGHQLLSTQPEQINENQPYKKATLHIVADVRLDNRATLKKQFGLPYLTTDYQLILAAYQQYGTKCVQHFIGAFVFVIWDEQQQQLFCARDQMGVKPFNYYFQDGLFVFGTQKKSILALEGVNKEPDWRNILNKISSLLVPQNSTPYKHIQILAPAHLLIIEANGLKIEQYWELDIYKNIVYKKEEDYLAHFNELFHQAIYDRMIFSNGVGTHLSGGLDSSGITSVAHQIAQKKGHPLHAFSYGVPRNYQSENIDSVEENLLAFDLVDYCKIKNFHNVFTPILSDFKSIVEAEALTCDGFAQSNNVDTEYELQAAIQAQNVDVVLSGFGGDELVTSFCRDYYLEFLERGNLWAFFTKKAKSRHTLKTKFRALIGTKTMQYLPEFTLWTRQQAINYRERKTHYAGEGWVINKNYFNSNSKIKHFLNKEFSPSDPYHESLRASQKNHVCSPHTSRRIASETLAGLQFKVEYRYPMIDIRLLQFVLSIPMEQKINPTTNRYLFRRAMKTFLPDSIRLRDMKYKGSLKTTHLVNDNKFDVNSKFALWENIKAANAAPFMNQDLVDKYIRSNRNPFNLYKWMVLGQLGVQGRFRF